MQVEINADFLEADTTIETGPIQFQITLPLDEDYWLFRVKLYEEQAILGFPKFGTIGIGFAQEKDWNTNLPYTCEPLMIYDHIKHNKKYDEITDEQCLEAIRAIQEAVTQFIAAEQAAGEQAR
jgi:hypothetical protein